MSAAGWRRWGLPVALFVASLTFFAAGLDWPRLHPDEPRIAQWSVYNDDHAYVRDIVYPHGFFMIQWPVRAALRSLQRTLNYLPFWTGAAGQVAPPVLDDILVARWVNAVLCALAVAMVYALGTVVTGCWWAGLLAALLLAGERLVVEHAHYAETDGAMLFTLSLAIWAWAAGRGVWALLLAAGLSGFAAGTKFTLAWWLLAVPFGAWRVAFQAPLGRTRAWLAPALLAAGMLAFGAGLLLACPGVADVGWFVDGLKGEAARVYGETRGLLGTAAGDPSAARTMRTSDVLAGLRSLGVGWLVLAVAGAGMTLVWAPARRHLLLLLGWPALLIYYLVWRAPWVRSQERLALLPSLAVLATLPAAAWAARATKDWTLMRRWAGGLALAGLAAAALAGAWRGGWAVASQFTGPETRIAATTWLAHQAPRERTVLAEIYTYPAFAGTFDKACEIYKIERDGLTVARERDAGYLLRNQTMWGRGTLDVRTGRRFPEYAAAWDIFSARSERLKVWGACAPSLTTFQSPQVELYGLRPPMPEVVLHPVLPQPLVLETRDETTSDPEQRLSTVPTKFEARRLALFPEGATLGAAEALRVNSEPGRLWIGGPGRRPAYLVLITDERPAQVTVDGYGRRQRVALEPFDARVVRLERARAPWFPPQFERVTVAAAPMLHVFEIPCLARVAFDPVQAARICREHGRAAEGARVLAGVAGHAAEVERFRCAVTCGDRGTARATMAFAAHALRTLVDATNAAPERLRVDGVNGFYREEFAHYRFAPAAIFHADALPPTARARGPFEARVLLPFRVAQGRYGLQARIRVEPVEHGNGRVAVWLDQSEPVVQGRADELAARGWAPVDMPLVAGVDGPVMMTVRGETAVRVWLDRLVLRWPLASQIESVTTGLAADLAESALWVGDRDAARGYLAALRGDGWNAPRVARLCAAVDEQAPSSRPAASTLLDYTPFYRVTGANWDATAGQLNVTLEALCEEAPGVEMALVRKRGLGRWKLIAVTPVAGRLGALGVGESVTVRLPTGAMGREELLRNAFVLQANTPFQPGALTERNLKQTVVPVGRLLAP